MYTYLLKNQVRIVDTTTKIRHCFKIQYYRNSFFIKNVIFLKYCLSDYWFLTLHKSSISYLFILCFSSKCRLIQCFRLHIKGHFFTRQENCGSFLHSYLQCLISDVFTSYVRPQIIQIYLAPEKIKRYNHIQIIIIELENMPV